METNKKVNALIISPAKDGHKRVGKGFSLSEIKQSGKTIELLRENHFDIDYKRMTSHATNVEILKNLKVISKKDKKKEPFTYKEKKRTTFKVPEEKVKVEPTEIEKEEIVPTEKAKKAPIKKEKVKVKKEVSITEEAKKEGLPLNSLSGLGPTSASKFKELGVETVDQLIKENPSELASLLKGISEERIKKWIEEGKELLK